MKTIPLLLLLGGCAAFGGDRSTPQGQCQAQAYDDPVVKDLTVRMLSGGGELQNDLLPIKQAAVQDSVRRCLAARGFGPPGGVERRKTPV